MLRKVCTIVPSFFYTTSGMHRRPIEGSTSSFNCNPPMTSNYTMQLKILSKFFVDCSLYERTPSLVNSKYRKLKLICHSLLPATWTFKHNLWKKHSLPITSTFPIVTLKGVLGLLWPLSKNSLFHWNVRPQFWYRRQLGCNITLWLPSSAFRTLIT